LSGGSLNCWEDVDMDDITLMLVAFFIAVGGMLWLVMRNWF